jgi:Ni,Fe-hydrogenase III small subunit
MRDFIKSRIAQGTATLRYPDAGLRLPERFRGLPRVVRGAEADLGQCLFSPEESAASGGQLEFTSDHCMASSTRPGLVVDATHAPGVAALERRMKSLFGRSLRLRSVAAGSCNGCEAELVALSNVVFDLARFGVQFVASPRHADGLVVTGAVSINMRDALMRTHAAVPEPRLVIAVGACAISGGPFRGSPEVSNGVADLLPDDLYVPGCPPHPLTVLDGLLRLHGRVEEGRPAPL